MFAEQKVFVMNTAYTIQLTAYEKEQVRLVKAYVDGHLDKVLNARKLAQEQDISLYKLKAGFMQLTGKSFRNYVKVQRMEKAKELLRTSNKIIYEIARDCGYRDGTAFVRAFRKWFGQTPDVFRKK
jgi:AraC-like DNA-binding protein